MNSFKNLNISHIIHENFIFFLFSTIYFDNISKHIIHITITQDMGLEIVSNEHDNTVNNIPFKGKSE